MFRNFPTSEATATTYTETALRFLIVRITEPLLLRFSLVKSYDRVCEHTANPSRFFTASREFFSELETEYSWLGAVSSEQSKTFAAALENEKKKPFN